MLKNFKCLNFRNCKHDPLFKERGLRYRPRKKGNSHKEEDGNRFFEIRIKTVRREKIMSLKIEILGHGK